MTTRGGPRLLAVGLALMIGLGAGAALGLVADGGRPAQPRGAGSLRTTPPPTPPRVGRAPVDTLLAWTPGGLPQGFARSVSKLPAVDHATAIRSGTAWLTASVSAAGIGVDRPPDGFAIPLEVAGVNLSSFAHFIPPRDRSFVPALGRGEGVLGRTSARLRRVGPGGTLAFGGRHVPVAAVAPDSLVGAHELLVSARTAKSLGVTRERYLLIDPADGVSRTRLTRLITSALPPGASVRIRGPGETPYFRHGDAVLPPVKLKQFFGEFAARPVGDGSLRMDPSWSRRYIVHARIPVVGGVTCSRVLIPQLRGAFGEIAAKGWAHLVDRASFAGCYSPRMVNSTSDPHGAISHHSWGAAVDVNVASNPFGSAPRQDSRLVAVFRRWGFTWGGTWLVPDGMHFEFVRFASGS